MFGRGKNQYEIPEVMTKESTRSQAVGPHRKSIPDFIQSNSYRREIGTGPVDAELRTIKALKTPNKRGRSSENTKYNCVLTKLRTKSTGVGH